MAKIRTTYKRIKRLYKIRRYNFYTGVIISMLLGLTAIIMFIADYKILAGKLAIGTTGTILVATFLDNIYKNILKKNE